MTDLAASDWAEGPPRGRRDSLAPALVAALALHLALFALLVLSRQTTPLPLGNAVPITILAHDPTTDSRAAEAAPETHAAAVETPVAKAAPPRPSAAPPPPPAPPARPAPAKPAPAPKPVAKPTPVKAAPTPKPAARHSRPSPAPLPAPAAKPTPTAKARPTKAFSLDALQADIAKAARSAPARPAFAARGPSRAETAPRARPDAGLSQSVSASDLQGLQQLLERLWNPNCEAAGGETVVVPVHFSVADDGRLVGRVVDVRPGASPIVAAGARRAIDAVHEAEPYAQPYRGKSFTVNFDARKACAGR